MDYASVKAVHVGAVSLSLLLFLLRGGWMLAGSARLGRRWVRILPHVVDTVLLLSAIWLAFELRQVPGRDGWLTAKVIGLLAYVAAGTIALKRGRTRQVRAAAFAVALVVFGYIVAVAVTKNPLPWR